MSEAPQPPKTNPRRSKLAINTRNEKPQLNRKKNQKTRKNLHHRHFGKVDILLFKLVKYLTTMKMWFLFNDILFLYNLNVDFVV